MADATVAPQGAKDVKRIIAIVLLVAGLLIGFGLGYLVAPRPAPASRNVIALEGSVIHLSLLSGPEGSFTFLIGGLEDPTIEVPVGANITVHYLNIGNLEHSWVLVSEGPPYEAEPPELAIPGAVSPMAHMGTDAGGNATFSFTASPAGAYWYVCHIAGHASSGMYGEFVVK